MGRSTIGLFSRGIRPGPCWAPRNPRPQSSSRHADQSRQRRDDQRRPVTESGGRWRNLTQSGGCGWMMRYDIGIPRVGGFLELPAGPVACPKISPRRHHPDISPVATPKRRPESTQNGSRQKMAPHGGRRRMLAVEDKRRKPHYNQPIVARNSPRSLLGVQKSPPDITIQTYGPFTTTTRRPEAAQNGSCRKMTDAGGR